MLTGCNTAPIPFVNADVPVRYCRLRVRTTSYQHFSLPPCATILKPTALLLPTPAAVHQSSKPARNMARMSPG